ncbi:MAG: methylmalonyl Co-A mutase-associated GTPase MeaB [Proteobacteria bacterium]|nr:methylmalonyl Co-A mutase-associated GTPase MeaB [Pseudomonadota bacterium]
MGWTSPEKLIELIESGNRRGLSRAISVVENQLEGHEPLLNYAFNKGGGASLTLGITGPPGVGKSTLASALIKKYRALKKTVGVIAVDPTSPYTGGAFLGDRVRMAEHGGDSGVYIRSIASRKSLGGLSEGTKRILYLYKAFGFDMIIIETVGVGQDEIDISIMADLTAVLLAPGAGDELQMSKAGIMEVADLFIINKSDRPEAEKTGHLLKSTLLTLAKEYQPPVINTIADQHVGIDAVIDAIQSIHRKRRENGIERYRQRIREEIRSAVAFRLNQEIRNAVDVMTDRVLSGDITPIHAASEICRKFKL